MSNSSLVTINDKVKFSIQAINNVKVNLSVYQQVKLEAHNNSKATRSGTVRFVGELSGETGVYYGIELDVLHNILTDLSINQPLFAFVKRSELIISKKSNMIRASVGNIVNIPKCQCHGIIRYIGETEFKPETVLYGIQLEEPKGKHNGIVNGVKYFLCDDKYGIFMKETQIECVRKKKRDKKKKRKHQKHKQKIQHKDKVNIFGQNIAERDTVFLDGKTEKPKGRKKHIEYLKQLKKLQNTVVEMESDMDKLSNVVSQATPQNH